MHRIDTPTAQKDKFGQGKNGFTNGDPTTGTPSTKLNSDLYDALQEEVFTVVERSGIRLDKSQHDQLYQAVKKLSETEANKAKNALIDGSTVDLNTLNKLEKALGNDAKFSETVINLLNQKLAKNQNGADIPDKNLFLKNLGLLETVDCAKNALDKRTGGTVNGGVTLGQNLTISWGGRTATYQENGDIHGPFWGGHLSGWVDNKVNGRATWDYVNTTFVKDIRLGHMQEIQIWRGTGYRDEPHYVITGVYNGNVDAYVDYVQRRILQKNVNGNWINVWFM